MKHTENSAEPFSLIKTTGDLGLAVARGKVKDVSGVNKYGRAINGLQTAGSDIWDLSNAAATQNTWLAPTAARVHTIVSTSGNDSTGAGTLTLTGQPSDTNTCTIGTKVYTFQTVLTNVDGNVLIGALATDTIDNLIAAINLASGAGTTYATATTAGAELVEAGAGAADTMTLWDHTGSLIATTDTMDNASWGAVATVNGTGAAAVEVSYLADWDTAETTVTVYLHGAVGAVMSSAAVMINRVKVVKVGSQYGINAGTISATAADDATISASVTIGQGQTNMAIYGIPSTQSFYMDGFQVGAHLTATPATAYEADIEMLVNEAPDINTLTFLNKANVGLVSLGTGVSERDYQVPLEIEGPAIVKFRGTSTVADMEGTAEFCGKLVLR